MKEHKLEIENFCFHSVSDIKKTEENKNKDLVFGGIVTNVHNGVTKTGNPWGKITIEDYFIYGSNGDKDPGGGGSGKATKQMITNVIPDQVSILKLSHSDQLTVLLGQQYSVQVGKFAFDKGVNPAMQKIAGITTLPVIVIIKNGFYHILIEGFAGLRDANMFVVQLAKIGYKGTIVKLNNPVRVENITHK